jgi:hypothetical protein
MYEGLEKKKEERRKGEEIGKILIR